MAKKAKDACRAIKKTWLKLLKAEIKKKYKKIEKLEKKMIELEIDIKNQGGC